MMYLHFAQQIQEKQITIAKLSNNNQDNHVSYFYPVLIILPALLSLFFPQLVKSRR